jgi:hypothetical protein
MERYFAAASPDGCAALRRFGADALASSAHEKRVQVAHSAVLLGLRQPLIDRLQRRLCERTTRGDRPGA